MLTREDKLGFCSGCRDDFYNERPLEPVSQIAECWHLRKARPCLKAVYFSSADYKPKEVVKLNCFKTTIDYGVVTRYLQLSSEDLRLLRDIASGKLTDDANVGAMAGHRLHLLWVRKYISAVPMEGSDAPVECLGLLYLGRQTLKGGK